ncbi:uncharacterized protein DDB_G0280205-like [Uranotaenia lowii]|uniref:uncharacterized protein DDB_G0280205-like n=1 Tax=Uranotaenia lowii TaxID=190385 RepID=UPI002478C90E|nr:uncharacterized protein DDB_G0280205-like [Uranotaenia lowii]
MSSVHAVPFNRQYGSFRTSNAGIPKSPMIGGLNRGLIATIGGTGTSSFQTPGRASGRAVPTPVKNQENLPAAVSSKVIAVTPRSCRKALTSNGTAASSLESTKKIGLNSPLQSPQIIRSTRIEQNNWNKKLTSNFCSLHSKSPGSSGTSVESIVPKYTNSSSNSNGGALKASFSTFSTSRPGEGLNSSNGSQKRAYNVHKPIAKGGASKYIASSNNGNISSSSTSSTGSSRSNNGCVSHKIVTKKLYREANAPKGYVAQMATALSNGTMMPTQNGTTKQTSTSSTSSSNSSYSSKFPNGLPFENEFYRRPRRSLSEVRPTDASGPRHLLGLGQSQRRSNSSDTVSLSAYGDEFSRKPSNEDLFVDFTKSLPETPKSANSPLRLPHLTNGNGNNHNSTRNGHPQTTTSIVEYKNINHANYFYKFESVSRHHHLRRQRRPSPPPNFRGDAADARNNNGGGANDDDEDERGEEAEGEKSTVYVAVATWVPKCNRLPYHHHHNHQQQTATAQASKVNEPSSKAEATSGGAGGTGKNGVLEPTADCSE